MVSGYISCKVFKCKENINKKYLYILGLLASKHGEEEYAKIASKSEEKNVKKKLFELIQPK